MKTKVNQQEGSEVPVEILAESIRKLSEGMRILDSSDLNEKAIVLLLSDATSMPKTTVRVILAGLRDLERTYLKSKRKLSS